MVSDLWAAYNAVGNVGYQHLTVNHSIHFVDPQTLATTNHVDSMWSCAKQRNKRECGTSRAHQPFVVLASGMVDAFYEFLIHRGAKKPHLQKCIILRVFSKSQQYSLLAFVNVLVEIFYSLYIVNDFQVDMSLKPQRQCRFVRNHKRIIHSKVIAIELF